LGVVEKAVAAISSCNKRTFVGSCSIARNNIVFSSISYKGGCVNLFEELAAPPNNRIQPDAAKLRR
jgi:hypothetical protein